MWYYDLKYFAGEEGFLSGALRVENGTIVKVLRGNENEIPVSEDEDHSVSLNGAYVIPGLIDIHVHGAAGADFSDGDRDGLEKMAGYLAKNGITGFLPTSMTLPHEQLKKAFDTAVQLRREDPDDKARILGIHMEGPYLSEEKCGAQNPAWLKAPDRKEFLEFQTQTGGMIRIADIAPELPGAKEFAAEASLSCRVSAAHTNADYEQAKAFFGAGALHLTHLFNAMTPVRHREPGVIGAASESELVTAELISDGLHVHPSAVRMAFRLFPDRICLISDAVRCCGMPEGLYELGGQDIELKGGVARLLDGTIAGAASNLYQNLRNAISFGISPVQAIQAATIRPARVIGWDDRLGSIEEGKYADLVICREDLTLLQVILRGKPLPASMKPGNPGFMSGHR